jgi:eukaryotic-like serine/threonine-protein kinase
MIGKKILHYEIIEEIGRGGMGVVYLAMDTKLERKVALKFLPQQVASNSEEKRRFRIEAKAAASLNHPNIATIHSIEEAEGEMFIVMEYIIGKELKEIIKNRRADLYSSRGQVTPSLPINDVISYAKQIAEGLEAAHKKGITHRDIKSSNIMITDDGIAKIMDFGLAKLIGSSQITQIGSTIGTVAYMSPEQSKGEKADHRSDIWSLGVVLYEMLTGKMPFKGDYEQAIIYSILNEDPEPASEIDKGMQRIISKALAKDPDDRYLTAGAIANDLRTISEGGTVKTVVKQSKLPWIIAGAAVILIAIALFLFMPTPHNVAIENGVKTIAVLPFTDMSPNKDQEYFSDGLSEELINVLAKNTKLRVTARTSSFSFKGTNVDIKTIAEKLSVKNILEGSVQKSGNKLRISADLVNAGTDATLWSNTYYGTLNNIFALQDSIANSVASALNVTLLGKEALEHEQETDPETYNSFLLGNHFYNMHGKVNLEMAEQYYEKALTTDSTYAPAWVSLSWTHTSQADIGYIPVDKGYEEAREETETALELDPNLGSAYSMMGWIKSNYDWDWEGANADYKKALKLLPGDAGVISNAGALAFTIGWFEGAISLARSAVGLNPISAVGYNNLGYYTWYADSLKASLTAFEKCLQLNPQYPGTHMCIGRVYLSEGKPDSALAEMMKETEPFWQFDGLALTYYALGRKNEANKTLATFIQKYQDNSAFQIAEIYAYRGENDLAFKWLDRAYDQRDGGLTEMKGDPLMRKIESDPRYAAFMKKMKLPLGKNDNNNS